MLKPALVALALFLVAMSQAAAAAAAPSLSGRTVLEAVQRLEPGEFIWAPQVAPQGPVLIMVSVATQRAVVYRNGVPIGISTVSTGRPGFETETGVFTILQKHRDHRSNLYDDAPMPYMQRLTWSGVALHAGQLPGYAASHGCIRLPYEFARELFQVTQLGSTVVVTDESALPRIVSEGPTITATASQPDAAADYLWHPERAPDGPVSIVMSLADRRMVVLRNGVEIGSSVFSLAGEVPETTVYTLVSAGKDPVWMRVALPGQSPEPRTVARHASSSFSAPSEFRAALASVVRPGTTVIVTRDSLGRGDAPTVDLLVGEPHP